MLQTLRFLYFDDNGNNDKKYEDIDIDNDKDSGEDSYQNHQTTTGCFIFFKLILIVCYMYLMCFFSAFGGYRGKTSFTLKFARAILET